MMIAVAVVALLTVQTSGEQSDNTAAFSAFRHGFLEYRAKNWPGAIEHLLEARKAQAVASQRGKVFITGSTHTVFAPNYFLVKALLQLGSCDDASMFINQVEARVRNNDRAAVNREFNDKCPKGRQSN